MPGKDGTGPEGKGQRGRGMGPCRHEPVPAPETGVEGAGTEAGTTASETYGVGRGGKPRGCGRGHCGGRRPA
jgi:hypothetical protein